KLLNARGLGIGIAQKGRNRPNSLFFPVSREYRQRLVRSRLLRQPNLKPGRPLEPNVQVTNLCYLAIVALFVTSQAIAETAPAPAQGPGPLAKRIPCDAFMKQADGSWRPTRDVNVELPDGNVLTVGSA